MAAVHQLGLEAEHVSWSAQRGYAQAFAAAELVPTTGLVEEHRLVKDGGEVARIERAAESPTPRWIRRCRFAHEPTEAASPSRSTPR